MEDINVFVSGTNNRINFRKHGEIPISNNLDFFWWQHLDQTKSNGIHIELVKNTFTTYDNFLFSGRKTYNGTFYTINRDVH